MKSWVANIMYLLGVLIIVASGALFSSIADARGELVSSAVIVGASLALIGIGALLMWLSISIDSLIIAYRWRREFERRTLGRINHRALRLAYNTIRRTYPSWFDFAEAALTIERRVEQGGEPLTNGEAALWTAYQRFGGQTMPAMPST